MSSWDETDRREAGARNSWEGPPPARPEMSLEEALRTLRFREGRTRWTNPLKVPQTIEIAHATEGHPMQNVFIRVVIAPGETVELPSEWSSAIHRRGAHDGRVVGGQAPLLRREGQTYGVDSALDPTARATEQLGASTRRIAD